MKITHFLSVITIIFLSLNSTKAQLTLIDSITTTNLSGPFLEIANGDTYYYNVDTITNEVSFRDIEQNVISAFRPFANEDFIDIIQITPLMEHEWFGTEQEYLLRLGIYNSPEKVNGSIATGIYSQSGNIILETTDILSLHETTLNERVLVRRSDLTSSATNEILRLPSRSTISVIPGKLEHKELGDGNAFFTISDTSPIVVKRYNLDGSLRYTLQSDSDIVEFVDGSTAGNQHDNIFTSIDTILNGELFNYATIIDSSGHIILDTMLERIDNWPIRLESSANFDILNLRTPFASRENHYFDRATLSFINFPDRSIGTIEIDNQEYITVLENPSDSTMSLYDTTTFDSIASIPYIYPYNNNTYQYFFSVKKIVGESFDNIDYAYFRRITNGPYRREYLFLNEDFQYALTIKTKSTVYPWEIDGRYIFSVSEYGTNLNNVKYKLYEYNRSSDSKEAIPKSLNQVHPNPASTWFKIINNGQHKYKSVTLLNMQGQALSTWRNIISEKTFTFDLPVGIYTILVELQNGEITSTNLIVN